MFVRITQAEGRSYVKIVEAFRDTGGTTRQRVIASKMLSTETGPKYIIQKN
jgi:hypothetical protein